MEWMKVRLSKTPRQLPAGRFGQPEEVVTVQFLASEHASFITGTAFIVNGRFIGAF
ncbi:hypothetical protein [Peribacillus sp. SCS-155]|uniref:hypothetical protein n=1 Tax=Peribacillus sedimenti TaxID=3115297 RepID=UPI003906C1CB